MRISDWSSDVCSSDLDGGRDVHGVRPDRQGAGGEGAGDHDLDGACGVRDVEAALRACGLPGPRGLREEHEDRKSVVEGKSVSGRVDLGGRRIINNTQTESHTKRTLKE